MIEAHKEAQRLFKTWNDHRWQWLCFMNCFPRMCVSIKTSPSLSKVWERAYLEVYLLRLLVWNIFRQLLLCTSKIYWNLRGPFNILIFYEICKNKKFGNLKDCYLIGLFFFFTWDSYFMHYKDVIKSQFILRNIRKGHIVFLVMKYLI